MAESVPWKIDDTAGAVPWKIDDTKAPPAPAPAPTFMDNVAKGFGNLYAGPEILTNLATGAVGQAAGGLAGSIAAMFPGEQGQGARVSQKVAEALTYQPRTDAAKYALGKVGEGMEYANTKLGDVGEAIGGNAGRTIGESALPVALTVAPVPKLVKSYRADPTLVMPKRGPTTGFVSDTGEVFSGKDVGYARDNAAKLEAQEVARRHGIVTDPSLTNPTLRNVASVEQAGIGEVAAKLAMENESKWNKIAASDPDIDIRAPLSMENIKAVRERAAEPSMEIARTGTVPVGDFHLGEINRLRMEPGISNADSAHVVNSIVNRATSMLKDGMDASEVLGNISQLRKDARTIYKKSDAGPAEIAKAEVSMKIANTLEDMIDTHLYGLAERNPYGGFAELGDAYRQGRRSMAKSYALEDAFDVNTGQINPVKIGKMTSVDNALTGNFADIGKIAGVFPEVAELGARLKPVTDIHLSRYGIPGAVGTGLGGILGATMGSAGTGMALGGFGGALAGEALSRVLRNRIVSPNAQARGVNPVPRSMWDLSDVDPLGPRPSRGSPEIQREFNRPPDVPPMLPAPEPPPTGPRGPVQGAPAPYRHPNFQFVDEPPPAPPPGTGVVPGRPLTPQEQFAQDMGNFTAQDRTRYNRESAMDDLARQKAEAAAAALRQPVSRERVLDLNPMTGRLDSASRGLKGATPETISSTGNALERAAKKMIEGRAFDLTLEEKVAWDKAGSTIDILRTKE